MLKEKLTIIKVKILLKIYTIIKPIKEWYIKQELKDIQEIEDIKKQIQNAKNITLSKKEKELQTLRNINKVTKKKINNQKKEFMKTKLKNLSNSLEFHPNALFEENK